VVGKTCWIKSGDGGTADVEAVKEITEKMVGGKATEAGEDEKC
jgi:hypothetical protein